MAFIFCANCGSKAEYGFSPPNFCSKCGNSYSQRKTFASKQQFKEELQVEDNEYTDFEEEEGENYFSNSTAVPRIRNIQVEISAVETIGLKTVKMSDLINGNYNQQSFKAGNRQNINDVIDEKKSN
jgi:hypothetical protein